MTPSRAPPPLLCADHEPIRYVLQQIREEDAIIVAVGVDEGDNRQDDDVETLAANSFLDPDLIGHVQGGGTSLSFFLANAAPIDTVRPDQRQ